MKEVAVQRDILGLLAARSHENNSAVDIDKALGFPLAPVDLSLATCDGIRRKTNKSDLYDYPLNGMEVSADLLKSMPKKCHLLDLAAIVRTLVNVSVNSFRDLAIKILNDVPSFCKAIFVTCDSYKEFSIKNAERSERGQGEKFVIKNPEIRIPPDFPKFLSNGENKERMFQIFEIVWCELHDSREIYVARSNNCLKIHNGKVFQIGQLNTNHEEADTKFVYLTEFAKSEYSGTVCLIRTSTAGMSISR